MLVRGYVSEVVILEASRFFTIQDEDPIPPEKKLWPGHGKTSKNHPSETRDFFLLPGPFGTLLKDLFALL